MIPNTHGMSYVINEPDVVAEDFDGHFVILNLANGHYYSLEGCGGEIWRLLAEGHSPEQIIAAINSANPDLAKEVGTFIDALLERRLVRPDETGRRAIAPIAVDDVDSAPRLQVYDDLAELIYADPIHDVNEQVGWPAPRE